jgi:hypothetical protein
VQKCSRLNCETVTRYRIPVNHGHTLCVVDNIRRPAPIKGQRVKTVTSPFVAMWKPCVINLGSHLQVARFHLSKLYMHVRSQPCCA